MEQIKLLGQIVRQERKARMFSQRQLGELTGTGLNFISQLERGKPTVRLDKVVEVLHVLGIELCLRRGKEVISSSEELKQDPTDKSAKA